MPNLPTRSTTDHSGRTAAGAAVIRARDPQPSDGVARPDLALALEGAQNILIFSHLNPDPDTIGAALALRQLLIEVYGKNVTACYRGIVGRAENRELLRQVGANLLHATQVDVAKHDGIILVDCQPDYGFLNEADDIPILGVIDHHPLSASSNPVPYVDVRPDYGSTSTILVEYLRKVGLEPSSEVATALFYGLKTDTLDLSRRTCEFDVEAYEWLQRRIDRRILGKIENPSLTLEYFECLAAAIARATLYSSSVITEIGRMPYSDMVAEVADRLIRLEGIDWAVCFGMHGQRIYLSVRTSHPTRDAGELVKAALRDDGVGGGHDTMAAGRVQLLEDSDETYLRVVTELWDRFLAALGEDPANKRRIVAEDAFPDRIHPEKEEKE